MVFVHEREWMPFVVRRELLMWVNQHHSIGVDRAFAMGHRSDDRDLMDLCHPTEKLHLPRLGGTTREIRFHRKAGAEHFGEDDQFRAPVGGVLNQWFQSLTGRSGVLPNDVVLDC
jgi:hypothetical protein